MPTIENLRQQADRLHFVPGSDYEIRGYVLRERPTGRKGEPPKPKEISVLQLTEAGQQKKQKLTAELFPENQIPKKVPLGKEYELSQLLEGDVLQLSKALALSLIRRRMGGYVCSFVDKIEKLDKESFRARVLRVDQNTGNVRLLFDHWPEEYYTHEYVEERSKIMAINEPVSIGPECVINGEILRDGQPHEDSLKLILNIIRRNFVDPLRHLQQK